MTDNENVSRGKVVSLFTGAGGLDIGLEWAGFEVVSCFEINQDCKATLRHNRPSWRIHDIGDVRALKSDDILSFSQIAKGEVDLVAGGIPCQPFSTLGKGKGSNDPRNGKLFLDFIKVVRGVSPRMVLIENVPGLLSKANQPVVRHIIKELETLDYHVSYTVLNAANYGVGQNRRRLFILAKKESQPCFPFPTHALNPQWAGGPDGRVQKPLVTLGDVLLSIPNGYEYRDDYALQNCSQMVKERMRYVSPGQNFLAIPWQLRPSCWQSGKHKGADTFGRLELNKPCVTIRTGAYNPSKGRYIHPTEDRGLDTIEMAAIQGFPFEWEFRRLENKKMTLKSAGLQIGNAVPPLLAYAVGKALQS